MVQENLSEIVIAGSDLTSLPPDYERQPFYEQSSVELEVPEELCLRLNRTTADSPFLLYTALVAALGVCLQKYTDNKPITLGSPALSEFGDMKAIAFTNHLEPQMSFRQVLLNTKRVLVEAYAKPVETRFAVAVLLRELHGNLPELNNDMTLAFDRTGDRITGRIEFNSNLFKKETIERFGRQLVNALSEGLKRVDVPISRLKMLSAAEEREQLQEWNRTAVTVRAESVVESFERCAAEMRDAVAVSFADEQVSYDELNERASKLASELRRLGVGVESRVGILLERSVQMVVAVLGVLKSGGAYVPLEPEYPRARLSYLCEDAGLAVIISVSELVELLPAGDTRLLLLDQESWQQREETAGERVEAENLAYMLYTSGSTGMPKGVMVRHGSLSNHMQWMQQQYALQAGDCVLQKTPLSFDASVWEFLAPLLAGARLEIARAGGHRESGYLVETIKRAGVTVLQVVPSQLRMLLGEAEFGRCGTLRRVFYGGAAISGTLAAEFQRRVSAALINLYGPTETTIEVTSWRYGGEVREAEVLPIGEPIWNTQMYVLSEGEQLLPAGAKGELYVGGVSLARGYHQRPELTAERFVPDGVSGVAGARLYRTGDVGRYVGAGVLECLGRADEQVKVRGYRVELGEIEATLQRHAGIREAVVLTRVDESGEQHLVACVVEEGEGAGEWRSLQEWLKEQLPHYMVPSSYVKLEELPLLVNGKVDRQQLAVLAEAGQQQAAGPARPEPLSPVEQILAGIWREVLGVKEVGRDDNFFDLGGHSLRVLQVTSRVRKLFRVQLPMRSLFEVPTVRGLSERISQARRGDNPPLAPLSAGTTNGNVRLSFAQERLWFLNELEPNTSAHNVPFAININGRLNVIALHATFNEIIRRHEILRTTFTASDGRPVASIAAALDLNLSIVDLSTLPKEQRQAQTLRLANEEAQRPFNLTHGPFLHFALLRIDEDNSIVLLTLNHIVTDDWSVGVFASEVSALYQSYSTGLHSSLAELPVQYSDYSNWQREWLTGEVLQAQLAYWKQQLLDPPFLRLPIDHEEPPVRTYRAARQPLALPENLTEEMKALGNREGATLFMTLLACYVVLLRYSTRQNDILVGTPVGGRNQPEVENLIGFFVNLLVLRTNLSAHTDFTQLLNHVRDVSLDAYDHQDLPFEKLVEELRPDRRGSYMPLIQTAFALQNAPKSALELAGLTTTSLEISRERTTFDLTLELTDTTHGLRGVLEYDTDLFDRGTIKRLSAHFERIARAVTMQPDIKLDRLWEMLAAADREERALTEISLKESNLRRFRNIKRRPTPAPAPVSVGVHP
jgi:amino acid adenylation domain-containing protein